MLHENSLGKRFPANFGVQHSVELTVCLLATCTKARIDLGIRPLDRCFADISIRLPMELSTELRQATCSYSVGRGPSADKRLQVGYGNVLPLVADAS